MKTLQPKYKAPERHLFSKQLVPEKYKEVESLVINAVNQADFASISTDGWKDNRNRHFVNIIAHIPTPYLFSTVDTKNNEQSGKELIFFFPNHFGFSRVYCTNIMFCDRNYWTT